MGNCIITRKGKASTSANLITKNITINGTYTASTDNADGYSSVTVNVSGGSTGTLPNGYTQIPYVLTGTGSKGQSGFTLYNVSINASLYQEIVTITPSTSTETAICGKDGSFEVYYDNNFNLHFYGTGEIISNTSEYIENNSLIKNTTKYYASSTLDQIYIGYYRKNNYKYVGRIYSFRTLQQIRDETGTFSENEKLLNDLVPCIRNSDGAVGMFDLVYQIFYTSNSDLDPFAAPSI